MPVTAHSDTLRHLHFLLTSGRKCVTVQLPMMLGRAQLCSGQPLCAGRHSLRAAKSVSAACSKSNHHEEPEFGRVAPLSELQDRTQQQARLMGTGQFVQMDRDRVLLSRVIHPVHPDTDSSACCGYTLISVKRQGKGQGREAAYRVLGVHTCGRSVRAMGQRCKQHNGTAQFEVWRVREVAAEAHEEQGVARQRKEQRTSKHHHHSPTRLQQAMLLSSCQSLEQLEHFYGLPQHSLQVCVSVAAVCHCCRG